MSLLQHQQSYLRTPGAILMTPKPSILNLTPHKRVRVDALDRVFGRRIADFGRARTSESDHVAVLEPRFRHARGGFAVSPLEKRAVRASIVIQTPPT